MADDSTSAAAKPCDREMTSLGNLGVLPPELRTEIYDLVLEDFIRDNTSSILDRKAPTNTFAAPLLNVNISIRREAMETWLRKVNYMLDGAISEYRAAKPDLMYIFWNEDAKRRCAKPHVQRITVQVWRERELRKMYKSGYMASRENVRAIKKKMNGKHVKRMV